MAKMDQLVTTMTALLKPNNDPRSPRPSSHRIGSSGASSTDFHQVRASSPRVQSLTHGSTMPLGVGVVEGLAGLRPGKGSSGHFPGVLELSLLATHSLSISCSFSQPPRIFQDLSRFQESALKGEPLDRGEASKTDENDSLAP